MSLTSCRYYPDKYPEVDSYVMVNVKQVSSPCLSLEYTYIRIHVVLTNGFRSPRWVPMSSSSSTTTSTA